MTSVLPSDATPELLSGARIIVGEPVTFAPLLAQHEEGWAQPMFEHLSTMVSTFSRFCPLLPLLS